MPPWEPGRRKTVKALESPFDDVPPHLFEPLWSWLDLIHFRPDGFHYDEPLLQEVCLRLRLSEAPGGENWWRTLRNHCSEDSNFMLDLVHEILEIRPQYGTEDLGHLLNIANSNYEVNSAGNGLEVRVAPEVKQAVSEAVLLGTGSAPGHLTNAWNAAYGLHHDASKAYGEAIRAVEAALAPHVSPLDTKTTLGKMIAAVRSKPSKWKFALGTTHDLGGVALILEMMETLWQRQTYRHGGIDPARAETLEEARAAVQLAVVLVQFAHSGAFARS